MSNWAIDITDVYGTLDDDQVLNNALLIRQYLMDRGWSQAAVAGLVANSWSSTQINPGQCESGHGIPSGDYDITYGWGLGMGAWTPAHAGDPHPLVAYGVAHNMPWWSPMLQLMLYRDPARWMGGPLYPYILYQQIQDPYDAGYDFSRFYAGSAGGQATWEYRGEIARDIWYPTFEQYPYIPLPVRLIAIIAKKLRKRRRGNV